MGKNNRARRAAQARKKAQKRKNRGRPKVHSRQFDAEFEPIFTDVEVIEGLLEIASHDWLRGLDVTLHRYTVGLDRIGPRIVCRHVEAVLLTTLASIWESGWQPAEVVRQCKRKAKAPAVRLLQLAIAVDHDGRPVETLDQRWIDQVAGIAPGEVAARRNWLSTFLGAAPNTDWQPLIEVLGVLRQLGPIEILLPTPGGRKPSTSAPIRVTESVAPMLDKVRALLAQAESTKYAAEAETFTAKAQELMTRHAIDSALLEAADPHNSDAPITVRVGIDDPYVDAKSYLLHIVAEHGRCRAVFDDRYAVSTVVGFADDLAGTDLLFTSLLVQAQTALTDAARKAPPGARARSKSFRSSFLVAFATRIGERLEEVNDAVMSDVAPEESERALPVLAERLSSVDDLFGELTQSTVKGGHDYQGWVQGTIAADEAKIDLRDVAEAALAR